MSKKMLLSRRQFKLIKQIIELQVVVQEMLLFPEMAGAADYSDLFVQVGTEQIGIETTDHLGDPVSQILSKEEFFDLYTFYDD